MSELMQPSAGEPGTLTGSGEVPCPPAGVSGTDKNFPRVAVIGVHGVAHHDPGATANAMSNLLLSLPADAPAEPRYYDSFRSTGIQIPVQPLPVHCVDRPKARTTFGRIFSFLQEGSANFARLGDHHADLLQGQAVARGSSGHEYMRLLLQDYQGGEAGDAYVTTRLEGERAASAIGGQAQVHIYEVLWADLARPTNSFLSFLLSLFQLVLHLASLSRLAVDSASSENTDWKWKAFASVQRYAVRMLQIPIPFLKIILLVALFSCAPALSETTQRSPLLAYILTAVAGLVLAFLTRKRITAITSSPQRWTILAAMPAALGVVFVWLLLNVFSIHSIVANTIVALEGWLLLGIALFIYVIDKYEEVRPGVRYAGWFLYAMFFAIFFFYLMVSKQSAGNVPQSTLWTVEWILAALRVSWIFLIGFSLLSLILGSVAWRSIPKTSAGQRARGRAAVRTSRFALALPALLFLLFTTLVWTGMFSIAHGIRDPFFAIEILKLPEGGQWLPKLNLVPNPADTKARTDSICVSRSNSGCEKNNLVRIQFLDADAYREPEPPENSASQLIRIRPVPDSNPKNAKPAYLTDALLWTVGNGFSFTLILFLLSLFLLLWWVLPSGLMEFSRRRDQKKPPRWSTNEQSKLLGAWVSRGLDATSIITALLWCAIFLVPALYLYDWERPNWLRDTNVKIIHSFIALSGAAVLAVALKYGSPVLGAILDVDTYLRTSPNKATPRAKIVERYVSLLRYIARWRGPDGRGYDSVVIVAHSLGTLISADLLRFLKEAGDSELAPLGLAGQNTPIQGGISIRFLTMGSPIRQLLNRFFPHLYAWVRDNPDNGSGPLRPGSVSPPTIGPSTLPDPVELGVNRWVNVYRSGDYVGRSIWLDEWYCRTLGNAADGVRPQQIYAATSGSRRELCMGAGAHTHYWDDTAPDVAEQLNLLI